jgi:hypothetical protein
MKHGMALLLVSIPVCTAGLLQSLQAQLQSTGNSRLCLPRHASPTGSTPPERRPRLRPWHAVRTHDALARPPPGSAWGRLPAEAWRKARWDNV